MKSMFKYLMLLMALTVAGCAGYFSVIGLSQLFAGASLTVLIMAGILEVAKVITTTALHRYWKKFNGFLKTYMTIAVTTLMIITSAGIYGLLSNAYQKTANSLEIHDSEIGILESKGSYFEKSIEVNEKNITTKYKRMDQLGELRSTQERRVDSTNTGWRKRQYLNDIKSTNIEIQKLTVDIDDLNANNQSLRDSIASYQVKVLELESTSEVAGEVGPLKFLAEITGKPMSDIVNWLILMLIFVFDPLAIALIIATNKIFEIEGGKVIAPSPEPSSTVDDAPIDTPTKVDDIVEEVVEPVVEPVIPTRKIRLEDIKEKKFSRGYSRDIPINNTIQRIGSNKEIRNNDSEKIIFKNRK